MKWYGLVGKTLGHSLSPVIHRWLFDKLDVPGDYRLLEVPEERIGGLGDALRTLSIHGVNVTIPYKEALFPQLDALDDDCRKTGAVNTIRCEGGRLMGYNTDVQGLMALFSHFGISPGGKDALVLGSGGAAKAAVEALVRCGAASIMLASRTPQQAAVDFPDAVVTGYGRLAGRQGGVLINATPLGMWPHPEGCPLESDVIRGYGAVVDMVYNPSETVLMKRAKALGIPAYNGLYMLVAQAVRAQEIWQQREISSQVTEELYRYMEQYEAVKNAEGSCAL